MTSEPYVQRTVRRTASRVRGACACALRAPRPDTACLGLLGAPPSARTCSNMCPEAGYPPKVDHGAQHGAIPMIWLGWEIAIFNGLRAEYHASGIGSLQFAIVKKYDLVRYQKQFQNFTLLCTIVCAEVVRGARGE